MYKSLDYCFLYNHNLKNVFVYLYLYLYLYFYYILINQFLLCKTWSLFLYFT